VLCITVSFVQIHKEIQTILAYFLKEMLKADGMNNKLERNLGVSFAMGLS